MAREDREPGRTGAHGEAPAAAAGGAAGRGVRVRDAAGHGGDVLEDGPDGVHVRLDDGRQVLLPPEALRLERDGSYSIGFDLAPQSGAGGVPLRDAVPLESEYESGAIPLLGEELAVDRPTRVNGGVRLHRHVSERIAEIDEPVARERVVVERVRVDEPVVDGRIPRVHEREDGTLVVPVLEEVLVVRKRLVLKEELHVRRVREDSRERQSVPLRQEHVEVERFDASSP